MVSDATIATRRLELDGAPIDILLRMPRADGDGPDLACDYRITALPGGYRAGTGFGVDGIQALTSALTKIGDLLQAEFPTATFLRSPHLLLPTTRVIDGVLESVIVVPTHPAG